MPNALTLAAGIAFGTAVAFGTMYAANVIRVTRISVEHGAVLAYRADDAELDHYLPGLAVIRGEELWWYRTRPYPCPARVLHRVEMTLEEYRESTEPVTFPREPPVHLTFWTTRGRIAFATTPGPAKDLAAWVEEDTHGC